MVFDLRKEENLPQHLKTSLQGIHKDSLEAVKQYVEYNNIDVREIGQAFFDEGWGDVGTKCKVAADVAAYLGCAVHFVHNETPGTAYPTTSTAAGLDWDRRRNAGERA